MPPPWALEVHEVWPSRGVEFVTGLASSTWSPSGRDARVCWSRISVSSSCSWWCSSSGADRSPAEAAGVVRRPGARRSAPPGVGRVHVHHPVGGTGPGGQRSRVTRALGSPGTARRVRLRLAPPRRPAFRRRPADRLPMGRAGRGFPRWRRACPWHVVLGCPVLLPGRSLACAVGAGCPRFRASLRRRQRGGLPAGSSQHHDAPRARDPEVTTPPQACPPEACR